MSQNLEIHAKIRLDFFCRELQHFLGQSRLDAYPESVVHHIIGVAQIAANSVIGVDHVRLTGQVTGEEQSSSYFVLIQVSKQIQSRDGAVCF